MKYISKFVCLILCVLSCYSSFCFVKKDNNITNAESEQLKVYELLAPTSSALPVDERTAFTPINENTGLRFSEESDSARAFEPLFNQTTTINEENVRYFDRTLDVVETENQTAEMGYNEVCLEFWAYSDATSSRDFYITVFAEDGGKSSFYFGYEEILEDLNNDDDKLGYILVSAHLSSAESENGGIYDVQNNKLKKLVNIQFAQFVDEYNMSKVGMIFYDVKLTNRNIDKSYKILKSQPYLFYNIDFENFYSDLDKDIYVGDVWHLPKFEISKDCFAWCGKENILLKLKLVANGGLQTPYSLNTDYTFKTAGNTNFCLVAKLVSGANVSLPSSFKSVAVLRFVAVSADVSSIKAEVGKSYLIKFDINKKFYSVKDLQIISNNDKIEIQDIDTENGSFVVNAVESGESQIKISFIGERNTEEEYSLVISVNAVRNNGKAWNIAKICLMALAGVCVILYVCIRIKTRINANKYNIK